MNKQLAKELDSSLKCSEVLSVKSLGVVHLIMNTKVEAVGKMYLITRYCKDELTANEVIKILEEMEEGVV